MCTAFLYFGLVWSPLGLIWDALGARNVAPILDPRGGLSPQPRPQTGGVLRAGLRRERVSGERLPSGDQAFGARIGPQVGGKYGFDGVLIDCNRVLIGFRSV